MSVHNKIFPLLAFLAISIALGSHSIHAQIFNSTWQGGSGDWNDAVNWSTVNFPNNAGTEFYNVIITGGGDVVDLAGLREIDSLSVGAGGQLNLLNNTTLTIVNDPGRATSGFLFNSGDIALNATNLGSSLRFDGTITLSGGGTITLGNDAGNNLAGVNNGELINEDNLIQGSGTIGISNTLAFTNRGQVIANQSVPLNVILSQGVTNENLFRATNGAELNLIGGVLTNVGGTIEAQTNSVVNMNGADVIGGLIRTEGTGFIDIFGATRFNSSTDQVTVDGTVNISNNNTLNVIGDLINKQDINLNATNLGSSIRFDGDVSLSGGGVINMGDDSGNQLIGVNAGKLTNVDHLIRGSGTIGTSNTLELVNQYMIEADQATALNIVASQGVDNQGILRAKDGATLNLVGGIIQNQTGLIEAADGSLVNLQAVTINGGDLKSTGTGFFDIFGATQFNSTSNQVTVDGTVNISNNNTLNVIGDLINKQDINLNATSLGSSLRFDGDVSLSGGGVINMGDDSGNQLIGVNAGKLTNVDHLIRGSGTIGTSNTLELVNQYMIEADQATALNIVAGAGVDNQGVLRAKDGATLNIIGGVVQNQTGLIEAADGSLVTLQSATIVGGTLQSLGTGSFAATSTVFDGSTNKVVLDGTMNVGNNQTITMVGAFENKSNTINLNATSLASRLQIDGAVTLDGGGTINMANDNGSQISGINGGVLTNEDNLIVGSGTIGLSNSLAMVNRGTIEANHTVPLTVYGNQGVTNENIMRAVGGGNLVLNSGNFTNHLGQINATNGSTVNLQNTTIHGGELNADGTSTFISNQSYLDGTVSQVNIDGTVFVGDNRFLGLRGDISNSANTITLNASSLASRLTIDGTVNLTGGGSIQMNDDNGNQIHGINGGHLINENNTITGGGDIGLNTMQLTNRGTIDATGSFAMFLDPNAGGFLNDVGGVMAVSGTGGMSFSAGDHTNAGTILVYPDRNLAMTAGANFENAGGDVILGNGGNINVTGTYYQTGGETMVDGTLSSTVLNDFDGGVLSGNGLVNGASDLSQLATIAAGASTGILEFNDAVNMEGTFDVELMGNLVEGAAQDINLVNTGMDDSLIGFDQVNVFDTLTLADGVTIDVSRLNSYLPQVGDFYDIVTADEIQMLGSLNLLTDSPGLTFSTEVLNLFDTTTGTNRDVLRLTTLTAVPEPGSASVIGLSLVIATLVRRRRTRQS